MFFVRTSLYVLLVMGLSIPVAAQPRLFLPSGTSIDLGKLPEPVESHYSLSIKNTGSDTLRINNVTTSCGCTVAKIIQKSVAPGDSTSVQVVFNNKDINGPSLRHVFIASNDTLAQKVDITFAGIVIPVLKADPRYISFGTIRLHDKAKRVVHIENTTEDTISIISSHCFDERIHVSLNTMVVPPHVVAELTAECDASSSEKLLGEISFGTTSPLKPVLKISYTGKIVR